MQVMCLAQQVRKPAAAAKRIKPGIAEHRGVAEKAIVDGSREHVQGLGFVAQIAELPRQVKHSLRIAERRVEELLTYAYSALECRFFAKHGGAQRMITGVRK